MRSKQFSASAMLAVLGLAAVAGCEERPEARDAAPQTHRFSEVAVRLDSANGGTPSVSVLAYRASTSGVGAEEVLSVVDPVVADPPETGCALRDVAGTARTL